MQFLRRLFSSLVVSILTLISCGAFGAVLLRKLVHTSFSHVTLVGSFGALFFNGGVLLGVFLPPFSTLFKLGLFVMMPLMKSVGGLIHEIACVREPPSTFDLAFYGHHLPLVSLNSMLTAQSKVSRDLLVVVGSCSTLTVL
ncbi:Uncharacterized protein TCM_007810 [Theobroma cacao]|uniref:Uncharacterized protein n=1 Tax=Theobroma cacao TaxID=3641 RepID=A0A061E3N6_THECC|nr:Uncharacterized protein TCM_007810 [Theobroma cacao]